MPPTHLEFEVTFQDDNEMISLNDGTAGRIVVQKFELWVPVLKFTSEGQKMVSKNFLKPIKWTYLKETPHLSSSRRDASDNWLITPGVKNMCLSSCNKHENKIPSPRTHTSLSPLILMVTTQRNWLLAAFSMEPSSIPNWITPATSN